MTYVMCKGVRFIRTMQAAVAEVSGFKCLCKTQGGCVAFIIYQGVRRGVSSDRTF